MYLFTLNLNVFLIIQQFFFSFARTSISYTRLRLNIIVLVRKKRKSSRGSLFSKVLLRDVLVFSIHIGIDMRFSNRCHIIVLLILPLNLHHTPNTSLSLNSILTPELCDNNITSYCTDLYTLPSDAHTGSSRSFSQLCGHFSVDSSDEHLPKCAICIPLLKDKNNCVMRLGDNYV